MVKKNSIPVGWRNVLPIGQPIQGTRFIPFKAPLKGEINQRLTPAQKFTPKDLIAAVKALNLELGLIIDLTYTTRYYHVKDLPKSVEYKKLYTIGFEVPDDPTILQFKKCVRKFLWENAENDKVIGVHCTNGINRTGYLICRYLIDVEGWDPDTAIQAFGEARGHHIVGKIYLADLQTQPMRSNLGMNLWDADGDTVPPSNDMNGHSDRFPNEEFPRSAKRLRVFDYGHSDLSEEIQLREFDFINEGHGQQQKMYHDHRFEEDLQPLVQMGPARQFYVNNYQEHAELTGLHFTSRYPERRQSPFHDRQFCEDVSGSTPSEHFVSMEYRRRQKHFCDAPPFSDMMETEFNRGCDGIQPSFNDPQHNNKMQLHAQFREATFLNKRPMQRIRLACDQGPQHDVQPPVGDFEFGSRGRGQRMMPFLNHSNALRRQGPLKDFDDRDFKSRCRPFHDNQSYSDNEEQTQFKHFLNREPEQRIAFRNYSPSNDVPCERYLERDHPFLSHEHLSRSPLLQRDYGSNRDNYNRSCRPVCSENYRRSCHSEEKGGKTRFVPYSSHQMHGPPSIPQRVSSVSVNHRGDRQHEHSRVLSQGKQLPIVTIDYNYGLPLGYTSAEEDRTDLHTRECRIWE